MKFKVGDRVRATKAGQDRCQPHGTRYFIPFPDNEGTVVRIYTTQYSVEFDGVKGYWVASEGDIEMCNGLQKLREIYRETYNED